MMARRSLDALKEELKARADALLEDLLGQPSSRTVREWRWGRHGSLAYSPSLGVFYDHEKQQGGSLLDLIADRRACSLGEAADFARDWLGGDAQIEPRQIAPRVHRTDTIAAAKSLWSAGRTIGGTSAEKYLAGRHIAEHELDVLAMIPAAAFIGIDSMAWWRWSALAFLLTTADGRASAVQLVALDDDGCPVLRDGRKIKRTLGLMAGAAFRMPATADSQPALLLAEGPETGIACWQSTGAETWALCGSISRVVLSDVSIGRPLIVCTDDDGADAPASLVLNAAVERWRRESRSVRCAYPWALRRHDKSDFADLLALQGRMAVRRRILGQ